MSDWFKNALMAPRARNVLMDGNTPAPQMPQFQQPTQFGQPAGLKQVGNAELWARPILNNADGTKSTTRSFSIGTDLGETLIPQVINGKLLTKRQAIEHFQATGEHLGIFDTPENADAYATALHNEQAKRLGLTP